MPNRDMTGPRGLGPMTGRGLGYGRGNFGYGFRHRFGGGFHGRGFGYGRNADFYYDDPVPRVSRKTFLESQINVLKEELSLLEKELSDFNDSDKEEKEEEWD
ncbi:hypothetical protein MNBD_IGNAVI01-1518 [hydrothermal vent metagenome]|uniref:DUF5320 domain-containing protein n=1 Tax=hydrothermal vent metagenome TaxID=652676 RepID=A0A3B1C6G0_9ZZZZ